MLKVLIVEDERLIAMDIKYMLNHLGINKTTLTNSGEKAIKLAKENNFDLIIMDINLIGKIDGIQAAEKIQRTKKIPVLFCSAYTDKETKKRLSKVFYIGFIEKPIEDNVLKNILVKVKSTQKHQDDNVKYCI